MYPELWEFQLKFLDVRPYIRCRAKLQVSHGRTLSGTRNEVSQFYLFVSGAPAGAVGTASMPV